MGCDSANKRGADQMGTGSDGMEDLQSVVAGVASEFLGTGLHQVGAVGQQAMAGGGGGMVGSQMGWGRLRGLSPPWGLSGLLRTGQ